jgi:alanine racemase
MPIEDTRAWIEVDLDAMRANYDTIRRSVGARAAMIPMVKADGYGLGVASVVRALDPLEPWGFGVATAEEGAELRALGVSRPVLVVTPLPAGGVDLAARSRLTVGISSLAGLDAWIAAADRHGGDPLDFHVEVDTGMGRSGFDWRERGEWGPAVASRLTSSVRWSGCYTHFHSADSPDERPSLEQWERFRQTLVQLPVSADGLMIHAANSAAALRWPRFAAGAVRPGIFLYGGRPAPEVAGVAVPRPVASVRARLALVREKPAGSTAGYSATYEAREAERWGTVSIGYGDGIPRALGNRGSVLVRGVRVPVIGRLSMDLVTVLLRGVPGARVGDVVTLIGADGDERITVDEVASLVDTIGYEILTGLGRRLTRIERSR